MNDLEKRITALEKENAELKRQLEERHQRKFILEDSEHGIYKDLKSVKKPAYGMDNKLDGIDFEHITRGDVFREVTRLQCDIRGLQLVIDTMEAGTAVYAGLKEEKFARLITGNLILIVIIGILILFK